MVHSPAAASLCFIDGAKINKVSPEIAKTKIHKQVNSNTLLPIGDFFFNQCLKLKQQRSINSKKCFVDLVDRDELKFIFEIGTKCG